MPIRQPHVTAQGPFAVGSVLWRDAHGRLVCTVVAKATYALVPGESAPLESPLPIQEEDGHWDDDASKSVYVPSDLAPFKQAAEVVIVGSAFAPNERPAPRASARVVVEAIDKLVDVWRPRRFRQDGLLEDSAPLKRFSLRYEYASGGPGTDNPVGIDMERADPRGKYPVPQIVPPSHAIERRDEFVPSIGLGPIAPSWPSRASGLTPTHAAWLRDRTGSPLPAGFFARFFQVAPPDQWLSRGLAANERLVLEGLHPEIPRLVTNFSGIEPRAIVVGSHEEPRRMQGDLLFIDTDRGQATLTYRAQIPVDEGLAELRVIVVGAPMGSAIGQDTLRAILAASEEIPLVDADEDEAAQTITPPPRYAAPVRPKLRGEPDAVTTTQGTLPEVIRIAALPFSSPAAPMPAPIAPPPLAPPPIAPALHTPAPATTWKTVDAAPPLFAPSDSPPASSESAAPRAPRESAARAFGPPLREVGSSSSASTPPSSGGGGFGGVKAASDAAAGREHGRDGASPFGSRADAGRAVRRLAVIDLLSFDPKIAPRLRALKRFAPALTPPRAWALPGVDAPRVDVPDRDRADVIRVLSCATPGSASDVRNALADSLEDLADLDPPFVLVAGELRPLFDEVETLRAAVAIAKPVAGGDKKLLSTLAIAEESLASPLPPRGDTALGLARQIEQASLSLSLPPRYVGSEVERVLLEGRKYKRRTLLGAARVRADLFVGREGAVFPLYLLDSIAASLPLLLAYPVTAICEVRPREDLSEAASEALFAVALGRVLHGRNEG